MSRVKSVKRDLEIDLLRSTSDLSRVCALCELVGLGDERHLCFARKLREIIKALWELVSVKRDLEIKQPRNKRDLLDFHITKLREIIKAL